jgi:anthranilate synthase component II
MKIAVIDNYDSFVFNLVRYLREESDAEIVVMRNRQVNYEILEQADAIVLSPGPGIPSEAGDLMKIIELFKIQKPILGVCLGHQALGESFGLKLKKSKNIIHGKATEIKIIEKDILFDGMKDRELVGRYHSWIVEKEDESELIVTAVSDENEVMAFKHKQLPISGMQFHPESILTPKGRQMIQNWIKTLS